MALSLQQLEEFALLLRRLPRLMDAYEARQASFTAQAMAWLREVEGALDRNRMPLVSHVSELRGQALAANRGVQWKGLEVAGSQGRRRLGEAATLRAVTEASQALRSAIADRSEQFGEAEKVARQILSIASLKQLVGPCQALTSDQHRLECLISAIVQDGDLIPYYAALKGLVSHHDALVLLGRATVEVQG